MKKYMSIIAIVLFLGFSHRTIIAQNMTVEQFKYYENNKLNKINCFFSWTLFPGGGGFYSKSASDGIMFFGLEITGALLCINNAENKNLFRICFISTSLIKLFELFISFENIDAYNQELLDRIQRKKVGVNLQIKIPI